LQNLNLELILHIKQGENPRTKETTSSEPTEQRSIVDAQKTAELAKKWHSIALEDFQMAELSLANNKLLYAAFHLQQSMEKALKGRLLYFQNAQPPYLHDLVRLAEMLSPYMNIDQKYVDFFSELNPFYIRARYPEYKNFVSTSLNKETVTDFLNTGKEVLEW
jgi:HEPN domain-containing protein